MTSKHFLNKSAKNVISYLLRLMTDFQLYFGLENLVSMVHQNLTPTELLFSVEVVSILLPEQN